AASTPAASTPAASAPTAGAAPPIAEATTDVGTEASTAAAAPASAEPEPPANERPSPVSERSSPVSERSSSVSAPPSKGETTSAKTPAKTTPVTGEGEVRAASSAPPRAVVASENRESEPASRPSKKGGALVYGLAAAAVAIAGVGLAMRAPSDTEQGS